MQQTFANRIEAIIEALDGNKAEAARRLSTTWPTIWRWLRGAEPRGFLQRQAVTDLEIELHLREEN